MIGVGQLLQPLHNLARDRLLEGPVIHMDETTVKVHKGTGKAPTATNYMWVQTGGPPDKPVVIYDYDPGRGGDVPVRLLEGWQGYLMTDGFSSYSPLAKLPLIFVSPTGSRLIACPSLRIISARPSTALRRSPAHCRSIWSLPPSCWCTRQR